MRILAGIRFLLALGIRLNRVKLIRAIAQMYIGYITIPLAALAFGRFTDDAIHRHGSVPAALAILLGFFVVAELVLGSLSHLDYYELAEEQQYELRNELMRLVNGSPGIEQLDDSNFADNAQLVAEATYSTTRALEAVLRLIGQLIQTGITVGILVDLNPLLAFLPVCALPPVYTARRAQLLVERAREQTAERTRRARHLTGLATQAAAVKELRLFGAENDIVRRYECEWRYITHVQARANAQAAVMRGAGVLLFVLGYAGAILLVAWQAAQGRASIGDLVVVITLAVQVSTQISGTLSQLNLLGGVGRTVSRIEEMRAAAGPAAGLPASEAPRRPSSRAKTAAPAPLPAPGRLREGIILDHVSFTYPGTSTPVIDDVNLTVPAGAVLALVGENGAGKSTLVKLMTGMYTPTAGRILVDGTDLRRIDLTMWRATTAALFQDFARFEFTLRESIGLGQVTALKDEATASTSVTAAISDARAERLLDVIPGGLDGYTGRKFGPGIELSGGQWQLVALARTMMRTGSCLLILDEPAASLDPAIEHELWNRYAAIAAQARQESGAITILVSHRFSTVMMADIIAVLDRGRLTEHGTHHALLHRNGLYADLYKLQANAYR